MSPTIIGPVITASALLVRAVIGNVEATIIGAVISAIATVLGAVIVVRWQNKPDEIPQQARNAAEDNEKLDEFSSEDNSPDRIIKMVEYSLGRPRDVWGKLLMIRMALRRLLRSTAEAHGIQLPKATSGIQTTNDLLRKKRIIDENLHDEIEKIRDATFTTEWGIGKEAHPEDVQFILKNYKEVFAKLKERMRTTGPT